MRSGGGGRRQLRKTHSRFFYLFYAMPELVKDSCPEMAISRQIKCTIGWILPCDENSNGISYILPKIERKPWESLQRNHISCH
ncbi:hypothetical protein OPV22_027813 [Ensete ventricosum]|uniref:Uncharacterized protein n=1 Tax=Ensete ventricosum TaxID=4639 RepID=A0AAV8Q6T8_ENSVE|nr:hypothetical protein OPV22_027813 [Ensete ventricosum]